MSNQEEILSKIKKLLRLGESNNEHESAQALGLAQKLIFENNISEAMLHAHSTEPEEEIRGWEDYLYKGGRISSWRSILANHLAKANGAKILIMVGSGLKIFGQASNVQTVRYLFDYCQNEIERLAKKYAGNGRVWVNNYKLGCVDAIRQKLDEEMNSVRNDAIAKYGDSAKNAIVKVDSTLSKVDDFVKRTEKTAQYNYAPMVSDKTAREIGKRDGSKINMNSGVGLGAGNKGLPGR